MLRYRHANGDYPQQKNQTCNRKNSEIFTTKKRWKIFHYVEHQQCTKNREKWQYRDQVHGRNFQQQYYEESKIKNGKQNQDVSLVNRPDNPNNTDEYERVSARDSLKNEVQRINR